jgi:hypothetical protein
VNRAARTPAALTPAALTPAAAILLGAATAAWCATPIVSRGLAGLVLALVIICVTGGALRLSLTWIPVSEESFLQSPPFRAWLTFLRAIRIPPWEEGTVITALWLEVQHPARPWHTAVLGAILTAYLITVHLAESGARAGALRPQAPVLAAGACLLAVGAGAGMLPAVTPGAGSALLRVVAAIAVILAAGLVVPFAGTHRD